MKLMRNRRETIEEEGRLNKRDEDETGSESSICLEGEIKETLKMNYNWIISLIISNLIKM